MNDDPTAADNAAAEPERERIARYVTGLADPAEAESLEARLVTDEALRLEVDSLRAIWERAAPALHLPLADADRERAWRRLSEAIRAPVPSSAAQHAARLRRAPRWRRPLLAASMLAAAVLAAVLLVPTRRAGPPPPGAVAISSQRYTAPAGAPLALTLDDGSRVVLAPGSQLLGETSPGERRVTLEGRAYFDVVPDETRPFLVDAGGTRTRVLGTRFDVRAYPGGGATEVMVRSGRVAVSRSAEARPAVRPLGAGDRVRLRADGSTELESGLDVESLLAWTEGNLVFRGTPLRDVVPELEGWFGITIRISDPALAARRITATFAGEPEDVVLGAVAELVGARVERSGRQVVFVPFRRR